MKVEGPESNNQPLYKQITCLVFKVFCYIQPEAESSKPAYNIAKSQGCTVLIWHCNTWQ